MGVGLAGHDCAGGIGRMADAQTDSGVGRNRGIVDGSLHRQCVKDVVGALSALRRALLRQPDPIRKESLRLMRHASERAACRLSDVGIALIGWRGPRSA